MFHRTQHNFKNLFKNTDALIRKDFASLYTAKKFFTRIFLKWMPHVHTPSLPYRVSHFSRYPSQPVAKPITLSQITYSSPSPIPDMETPALHTYPSSGSMSQMPISELAHPKITVESAQETAPSSSLREPAHISPSPAVMEQVAVHQEPPISQEKNHKQLLKDIFFPLASHHRTAPFLILLLVLGVFGAYVAILGSTISRIKPITFQGRLLGSDYVPATDGNYSMKFRIFDAATSGTCMWATGDTANTTTTNCTAPGAVTIASTRGFFAATLGDGTAGNPVFPYDFTDPNTYLEIVIANETTTPRTRLTATPYALNAQEVAGLALAGNISGAPSLNGSYLSFGAGTSTATTAANASMHAISQKTLSATNANVATTNAYTLYIEGAPLRGTNQTVTNDIALGIGGAAVAGGGTVTNSYGLYVNTQTGASANYAGAFLGGNVGVGTASPTYILDVATSSAGILGIARLQNSIAAATSTGAQLLFAANRTTSGMTNVAGIAGIITSISQTAYTGALALYTASSTEPVERMRIDHLGNVGIGATAPITQLHVPGRVPSAALTSLITGIGEGTSSVFVQGRYAYITNNVATTASNRFQIIDISNLGVSALSSSNIIGSLATLSNSPHSVFVKGRYAYVVQWVSATSVGTLQVIDISNPSSPSSVGSVTTSNAPFRLSVQGRYAYVISQPAGNTNSFQIFDISDPAAPVLAGQADTNGVARDITVQGRYAHITTANPSLQIFDVSNPASPALVSGGTNGTVATTGNPARGVAVQGRFAYVTSGPTDSANTFQIFDISNPASPTNSGMGSVSIDNDCRGVTVQGRYAYITCFGSRTLRIFDVSNHTQVPTSIANLTNSVVSDSPFPPAIHSRFILVPLFPTGGASGGLQVFDLGGAYIQQLEAGGLEAASADIRTNLTVNNGLSVSGGITVGMGGIFSTGSLAISTSHKNAISIASYGTSVGNTGELRFSEITGNGDNYVGFKASDSITTSTVWALPSGDGTADQVLTTNGSSTLDWTTFSSGTNLWTLSGSNTYYAGGKISVGTSTAPTALLTLIGGGIMIDSVPQQGRWNSRQSIANVTTAVDTTGTVGQYTSITIGTDGLPVISYHDSTNGDLKVLKCGNTACSSGNTTTILDAGADTYGQFTSIAIGTDGYPVVSYRDVSAMDLRVAKCGNAACSSGNTTTTIDSIGNVGIYTSIAIGTDGFPVVSYGDSTNNDLKVAKCGNAACNANNTITIVDSTGDVGSYSSITIGTDGLPIISYRDTSNGNLKVAKCGNAVCNASNMITAVDWVGIVGEESSITIGTDGLPVIAYLDTSNGNLKVVKCGNAVCNASNTITTVDLAINVGSYPSITLGVDLLPVIAYSDYGNSDLKILKCSNAACSSGNTATTVDSTGNVGQYSSITIGIDGLPIVSYFDDINGDLKVLKCGSDRCINNWTRR